ncbi:MAG: hypothetical protein IJY12_05365 [Clostridia bacterium]|nr:hypothetical protein [Clostridia bacterium]
MKRNMKNMSSIYESLYATGYRVTRKDLATAAKGMAAAFYDDPCIRYLLGGEKEGISDWRYFYCVLKAIYGKSVMLSTDEGLNNLLVLFPPGLNTVPILPFLFNGGIRLCECFGFNLFLRSLNYEKNCQAIKSRFLTPRIETVDISTIPTTDITQHAMLKKCGSSFTHCPEQRTR